MKYKKPDPFYLSKPWRKIREAALCRDNYLCQICLKKRGRIRTAVIVHHVLPIETHPEKALVLENLQSLCMPCHNRVHGYGQGRGEATLARARIIKG